MGLKYLIDKPVITVATIQSNLARYRSSDLSLRAYSLQWERNLLEILDTWWNNRYTNHFYKVACDNPAHDVIFCDLTNESAYCMRTGVMIEFKGHDLVTQTVIRSHRMTHKEEVLF